MQLFLNLKYSGLWELWQNKGYNHGRDQRALSNVFEGIFLSKHNSRDTVYEFCWYQHFFSKKSAIFSYREMQKGIAFACIIFISFEIVESLKFALINMIAILMMSALRPFVPLRLQQNLSRNSNNIVNVVMWQKFDSSSISMREVIITSTF